VRFGGSEHETGVSVEIELVDERAPATTRTIEVGRPHRRARELLLVAVAAVVLLGIGVLGGGDDGETVLPGERRRNTIPYEDFSTTTTTARRTTTTTSWPQYTAGTGPMLPGPPTATALGVLDGRGLLTVVDLDTGDRCQVSVSRDGSAWFPWPHPVGAPDLVLHVNGGLRVVDRACGNRPFVTGSGWPAVVTAASVWMHSESVPSRIDEISRTTGEATGRTMDLQSHTRATLLAAGGSLVVGVIDHMALVDGEGRTTDLGTGTPIAAGDNLVAFVTCPEIRCRLGLLGLRSGARRHLDIPALTFWEANGLSPDGRVLAVAVNDDVPRPTQPATALVDVETGRFRVLDLSPQGTSFSADSRWLIGSRGSTIVAVAVERPDDEVELDLRFTGVQSLAVLTTR